MQSAFNEVQSDKQKRRQKVAADKASGKTGSPQPRNGEERDLPGNHEADDQVDRNGQPAAKRARREPGDAVEDPSDLHEGDGTGDREDDEAEDDEGHGDETEEDEGDHDPDERMEAEELEEPEEREAEDEALDNGEDSD